MLVDLQINQSRVTKMQMPQEVPNAGMRLKLTLYLHDDWLRLDHSGADTQSAAILPSIHSLHMVNAVKHEDTCHPL